jgi:hypothetical protein
VPLGVGLLFATVLLGCFRARDSQHLDWSNFLIGLAATVALLGSAAASRWLLPDGDRAAALFAWPGAFGAVSAGLVLGVAIDDGWAAYPAGLVVVALSALGYVVEARPAFVVSAIAGLLVAYAQLTDDAFDILDADNLGDNVGLVVGAVLFVFVLVVTGAGWFLPTRVYSGVVVGAVAVVGYATTLVGLGIARAFTGVFDDPLIYEQTGGTPQRPPGSPFTDDIWWIIAFSVVLIALWLGAAWVTGHVGFRLLVVAMLASVVVLGTAALAVEHPTWWGLVLGGAGGAVLLLGPARDLLGGHRPATGGPQVH